MFLARLMLRSGRRIELTEAHLSMTYGGLLEGYPNAGLNGRIVDRLARRAASVLPGAPVHVIDPPRTRRDGEQPVRPSFGPVELLPAVTVIGRFSSSAIDRNLYCSKLVIAWFQEDAALPTADRAAAGLAEVDWERWAEDGEL
ncbi:hypothetical protein GCM10023322_63820 [Rugosimonospora acidiphila]|uniref:Uncharacterized protein n=1 Tax=Rugosimonospora acidiphila TaxID=556531 RepID=A0ABP9SHP0_9ACTN